MVISDTYHYLFIEIPLTASWATRHELCKHYDGRPILHKHASYPEFLKLATREQKGYFVFAAVRNPLDAAVSRYVKYKLNHRKAFSHPETLEDLRAEQADVDKFRFIQQMDSGFKEYFARFHRRPYNNIIELSRQHLDFIIRYENLQQDFVNVLRLLRIEPVGPVPLDNKTRGKRRDWTSYYTPDTIEPAKAVFGPFMRRWGYDFPADWGTYSPRLRDELAFRLVGMAQRFYWLQVRYNQAPHARVLRWLKARLLN